MAKLGQISRINKIIIYLIDFSLNNKLIQKQNIKNQTFLLKILLSPFLLKININIYFKIKNNLKSNFSIQN